MSAIPPAIIKKVVHHLKEHAGNYGVVLNFKDVVKAISRSKNRPHVLVAYLMENLKLRITPINLRRYFTNVHISVNLVQNWICLYYQ